MITNPANAPIMSKALFILSVLLLNVAAKVGILKLKENKRAQKMRESIRSRIFCAVSFYLKVTLAKARRWVVVPIFTSLKLLPPFASFIVPSELIMKYGA